MLALTVWPVLIRPISSAEQATTPADLARWIGSQLKMRKGLALDLGCGDASLALALAKQTELTIECVDADKDAIERGRRSIDAAGLYGTRITAAQGSLSRLNYPSYCASLIICGDEFVAGRRERDFRELYRVLSPNGVAWIGQSAAAVKAAGQPLTRPQLEGWLREAGITTYTIVEEKGIWAKITRPRSPGWDEWTHRSHDPANTFGSEDTLSGPAFRPHWVADYRPGLSSAAVAVAGGRVVLASLSYDAYPKTTPHIQVLDAYTGVELWARVGKTELPIERPSSMYSNRESCSDIAVVGDDLYLLGGKSCHVFDLGSGKLKQSIALPREVEPEIGEIWLYLCCVGDTLYGAAGKPPAVKTDWNTMLYRGVSRAVFALERDSGKVRWVNRTPASTCSLALGGKRLYFCDPALKLHALDADSGAEVWATPLAYPRGTEIAGCSYYRDKVWLLYNQPLKDRKVDELRGGDLLTAGHNRRELDAYAAANGKHLFKADFGMTVAGVSFAGGQVFGSGQHGGEGVSVLDADTGALKWKAKDGFKCTPSLAAPNCFLSQRGNYASILDLKSLAGGADPAKAARASFTGFRPSCSYPGVPANGMVYLQAEGCACASPIRGNIALIPGEPAPPSTEDRLVRGATPGKPLADEEQPVWATWRADVLRSGRFKETAPSALELLWTKQLPGRLTPLSVGHGLVFCGSSERKLHALDAASGATRWQHFTEGRVQAAPFLWRGRVYLSDEDGWVYSLRADRGGLLWQFRAALGVERIVGHGGFMSRWPARTGVLVHDDTAYFGAGYFPDEGTAVYAVDARTGEPRWEKGFNTNRKGSRTAGFVPDGALALANNRLYVPSGAGIPWQVQLDHSEHHTSFTGGYHVKGHHIMVVGKDLLAVTPGLEYVHHVHYSAGEGNHWLPVVTEDTIYQLNQPLGREAKYLVAGKREAYYLSQSRAAEFVVKKELSNAPAGAHWRWKAWKNEPMTAMIETGGTIFSGGPGKVYATQSADGKELWSAPVPGDVEDLAFHGGRLFVRCGSGTILCFGKKP